MWLWILGILVCVLAWAGWFVFDTQTNHIWIGWPAILTAVIVGGLIGLVVYRRIRAARAARALEKAIAQQAQEQALAAKPERAAEIQELHRQIQQGIAALKQSKLGSGASGADALYSLPWYVMVGPPGAGKTTALRHSGLVFPYLDPSGGGVKGVGGTRNCDWWFTNEAILLDTAGRYTTEQDDHDEWMAFLEQLLKFRSHKPLNGCIVAISVSELLDATDEQIEGMGKKVRARIDEMQSSLKMVLPVYVIFTKIDLVAGFTEFFGDLKKSERSQAWGSTLLLNQDKTEPGKIFDGEFDILVRELHNRGLKRMALERNRETKEKIYQFPLEFAAIKRSLADFMQAAFAPSAPLPPPAKGRRRAVPTPEPVLRGFYFTSGTQEGRPLDRVVGAMGRAFGLRGGPSDEVTNRAESKSYFLRDVFMNVIFPDKDVAGRTEAEVRRVRIQRVLVAAAACLVALLFLLPAIISFGNNRALVAKTAAVSQEAASVNWVDGGPAVPKVDRLDALRGQVAQLDEWREDRPLAYGFFMYQGNKLFEPALKQYIQSLREGFVLPSKAALEEKLKNARGEKYLDDYNNLKAYLLLDDKIHLNEVGINDERNDEWETGRLTQQWAEVLRRVNTDISEQDLKQKLVGHVHEYVDLLRRDVIPGEPLDKGLIEHTRDVLNRVGSTQRYYDQFVTVLIDQKYDERAPASHDNLKYPPITLKDIFSDREEVLQKVTSNQFQTKQIWFEVRGPYTAKGHATVVASLEEGTKKLEREKWVLPLTIEEQTGGDKVQQALDRVRQDYDNAYIHEWVTFFKDIEVMIPPSNRDAIIEFKVLSTPDWPYLRLLRALQDNTQFEDKEALSAELENDAGVLAQVKANIQRKIATKTRGVDVQGFLPNGEKVKYDPVPEKFKSMVNFGVPPPPPAAKGDAPPPPPVATNLSEYVHELEQLTGEMQTIEDGPPNADTKNATAKFEEAVKKTEGYLLKMDETGQELMTPLLMNPLKQAYRAVIRHAGGAASGLWEVMVWPTYRDKIKDRYPFNLAATRDASFEDANTFFKPKDGILWGFYDQYLKPFHTKVGHDFIPEAHLEESPRPAKPFTPFNPNLYNCLHRADEITDALYGDGGDKPHVEFNINLKTVSPIVSEVIFEIDGQKRMYRNEKEYWQSFKWPGDKPIGAKMTVRGAGGLDEEIDRAGPWGIFRLFEAGTTTAVKENDQTFTVTWQMTAPPVTVVMEVKPTRANHPFPTSFFRATNCPPSIGDRFGKGGGDAPKAKTPGDKG